VLSTKATGAELTIFALVQVFYERQAAGVKGCSTRAREKRIGLHSPFSAGHHAEITAALLIFDAVAHIL
jgi:hypothetical protein